MSKRVDGDGDTTMDDADQQLPPPVSGPSYAEWMKNLYDMGGKVRRTTGSSAVQRDDEIDSWRDAAQDENGFSRAIGP